MDKLTPEERSQLMAKVKSKNTTPEMIVRKLVFSMGYRYRLHDEKLPGKPDLVFPGKRKVILINGCFWHRHQGCKFASTPQSRTDYWERKFERTVERDKKNIEELTSLGWECLVIWECELKNPDILKANISSFLRD
ncbi:very short patch repair endonuclease [Burkholderia multivorans]|uniref:very short patch repair endonuclease n=1 Tax=Burkholderia multivorans TaxID=87883 RepID=UPI0021C146A3|nr:very short patch repair endonuclease [Burkholderia multivorans]